MARLPQPGGDAGNWGSVLNDYLSQAHNANGTLKSNVITSSQLAPNSVTSENVSASGGADGQVLTKDSATSSGLSWRNPGGGGAVDATTTTKGVVQLAGDLGGTATAPTVPGLASKANTADVYTKTQIDNAVNAKYTMPATGIPATDLATAVQTDLGKASSSVQSVNGKTGNAITLSASDIGVPTTLDGLSDVSSSGATNGQSLVFNGGSWGPATVSAGGPSVDDATATTKGVVQLAGDLGGTAAAPTVPGLASKANTADVYTKSQVDTSLAAKANTASLSTVATSGSYNDLTNRPTVPAQFNPIAGTNVSLSGTYPNITFSASGGGGGDPTLGGDLSGTASNAQIVAGAVTNTEVSATAAIAQSKIANLTTDLAAKATDNAVVKLAGAQTVAGVKTFSSSPVVPTPSGGTDAANKSYVDGVVSSGGAPAITSVTGNVVMYSTNPSSRGTADTTKVVIFICSTEPTAMLNNDVWLSELGV